MTDGHKWNTYPFLVEVLCGRRFSKTPQRQQGYWYHHNYHHFPNDAYWVDVLWNDEQDIQRADAELEGGIMKVGDLVRSSGSTESTLVSL